MRILVFFDLPSSTKEDKKEYIKFRKYLLKNGFLMLQESVYCKLALNGTALQSIIDNIRKYKPEHGLVNILTITGKQYLKMETVVGSINKEVIDTDDRLVIL